MTEQLANFQFPHASSSIIKVIGVGGGGCNAVNHMYEAGIRGVDYLICNTDAQALVNSPISDKVQLGLTLTGGRGAGNKPEMGEQAARESYEELKQKLSGNTKMVFIAAGMGGGTGTGAAPVIASLAHELDILTIAVVTVPAPAEGKKRFNQAMEGIEKLKASVDSLLVVSNQRLHNIYGDMPARQAFKMADDIVATAVKGVAEIITVPGNVNIDFTDVHTVMHNSKVFIMGTGVASGEGRALQAVNMALESPLLDSNDIYGTKNILLNIISGKEEITIGEIGEIIEVLQEKAGQEADIIWGNGYDESLEKDICVTILATGFKTNPNQLLQEKKEPEKFNLEVDKTPILQDEVEEEIVEVEVKEELILEEQEQTVNFEKRDKKPKKVYTIELDEKEKEEKKTRWFARNKKKREKVKKKKDEPISEPNIDNWFYKNFGLGNLFNDDDDSLE
ncbi:MAG: cell division protein FtsZ [Draconibacterium sp.]|nr:MAG: cell division protein FtsZ [Draconibacterium sp.]